MWGDLSQECVSLVRALTARLGGRVEEGGSAAPVTTPPTAAPHSNGSEDGGMRDDVELTSILPSLPLFPCSSLPTVPPPPSLPSRSLTKAEGLA